ncbi:MAG TPA: hypothetical protein PLF31_01875 [Candidatus Paceibacterota bacterium]|nr:hypothetical protein [Candidatus Paceibacterota bacterium]
MDPLELTPPLKTRRLKVIAAIIVILILLGALFVGLYKLGNSFFGEETQNATTTVSVEVTQ